LETKKTPQHSSAPFRNHQNYNIDDNSPGDFHL